MRRLLFVVGILNIAIVCAGGWVAWRVVRISEGAPATITDEKPAPGK